MYIPPISGARGQSGDFPTDPSEVLSKYGNIKALYVQEVIQLKDVIHNLGPNGPNLPLFPNGQSFKDKHTQDFVSMLEQNGYPADLAHTVGQSLYAQELQDSGGGSDPVQQFESSLKTWDADPKKTAVQHSFAEEILTRLTNAQPPIHTEQDLENFMTSFLKAPYAGSQRSVFFKFLGLQPQDIQSVLALGNLPNPIQNGSLLDQACYKFYGQDAIHPGNIYNQIAGKLQLYTDQMKTTNDKDAFADFQKFVQGQVFTDPSWSSLSSTDQQHIEDFSGCMPPSHHPDQETESIYNDPNIQPSFHNQFMNLQALKDLNQYKTDLASYAKITDPKSKAAFWTNTLNPEYKKIQNEMSQLSGAVSDLLEKPANANEIIRNLKIPASDFAQIADYIVGTKEAGNIAIPNLPADPTNPPIKNGGALFTYNNNSGRPNDQVFITITGANPVTGVQCFVKYDPDGTPHYIDAGPGVNPKLYSYPLSYFNQSSNGSPNFYLPPLQGGRIYTSIDKPLFFPIAGKAILAPDAHNRSDPNYSTTWDKTEFTVDNNCVFINPTAVDDFSLPMGVQESFTNGTSKTTGFANNTRAAMFDKMRAVLTKAGPAWANLMYTAPGTNASRITSPMNGLPADYFTAVQPGQTTSWMDAFYAKFSKPNSLKINEDGFIWSGQIDPTSNRITFVATKDGTQRVSPPLVSVLDLPTNASALLGAHGDAWGADSQLQSDLIRDLVGAVETNTLTDKEPISIDYLRRMGSAGNFYKPNPDSTMPQFIDYYSQVMHSLGIGYSFPYDDALGQGGEISADPKDTFAGGSITLGPLD